MRQQTTQIISNYEITCNAMLPLKDTPFAEQLTIILWWYHGEKVMYKLYLFDWSI